MCSDDQWTCDNGDCISIANRCDGRVECKDRSDETAENCIHLYRECPEYAFTCTYGACIAKNPRCIGTEDCAGCGDCADKSDELACSKSGKDVLQGRCGYVEF